LLLVISKLALNHHLLRHLDGPAVVGRLFARHCREIATVLVNVGKNYLLAILLNFYSFGYILLGPLGPWRNSSSLLHLRRHCSISVEFDIVLI
jgi:hypothetical protein